MTTPLSTICGQLIIGGFDGHDLPASFARVLTAGARGGAILFRRNLSSDLGQVARLTRAITAAAPPALPPLIGIDQEGGRVVRLGPPVLALPPMRALAALGDEELVERAAQIQAQELAALGFTMNFAPVLDVDTRPDNPVIGDRAFGPDAATVTRFGLAFARGVREGGLLACGKHFPGHGDTSQDSHLELPRVDHPRERLEQVELAPFRASVRAGIDAWMTAHVVYSALDGDQPATLSFAICSALARADMGFEGVIISDDLEMGAIMGRYAVDDAAIAALEAGCDMLLICSREDLQERVHEALVHRAETNAVFRERCCQAYERGLAMRRRVPRRRQARQGLVGTAVGGVAAQALAAELRTRGVMT